MEKEKNFIHTHIIIILIALVALFLSIFALVKINGYKKEYSNISYKVYIGLTDNEKNYQTMDTVTAKEIVKTICVGKGFSYTIYDAEGGHKDDDNILHLEKTIILEMDHITEKDLKGVLKDIGLRLNTQVMMVTKNLIKAFYYYPQKQ